VTTPPPPKRHTFGPVQFDTSAGPVEYSVEMTIGEVDTDLSHAVVMMTVLLRGETAIASLHHVDRVEIKQVDTEVEEDLQHE
jgi:hypothetical protein